MFWQHQHQVVFGFSVTLLPSGQFRSGGITVHYWTRHWQAFSLMMLQIESSNQNYDNHTNCGSLQQDLCKSTWLLWISIIFFLNIKWFHILVETSRNLHKKWLLLIPIDTKDKFQYFNMSICQHVNMSICQYFNISICQYLNISTYQYL